MNYPLQLRFKFFALAPQIYVQDSAGGEVCYVKQKLFRFKEKVEVFTNASRSALLATIQADRMIDFNANYSFLLPDGVKFGSVRRRGMRSILRAHYEILDAAGNVAYEVREENPWAKVMDSLLGDIPIIGIFTGFFFHPRYAILKNSVPVLHMTKKRAFLENCFTIEKAGDVGAEDELRIIMSLLMFVLLERSRG